jgi:hypothetical protein
MTRETKNKDDDNNDDETWADASEENDLDVPWMTVSCRMTGSESHFCLDGQPKWGFAAFKALAGNNSLMDRSTHKLNECHSCL